MRACVCVRARTCVSVSVFQIQGFSRVSVLVVRTFSTRCSLILNEGVSVFVVRTFSTRCSFNEGVSVFVVRTFSTRCSFNEGVSVFVVRTFSTRCSLALSSVHSGAELQPSDEVLTLMDFVCFLTCLCQNVSFAFLFVCLFACLFVCLSFFVVVFGCFMGFLFFVFVLFVCFKFVLWLPPLKNNRDEREKTNFL